MKNRVFGYARISTSKQSIERQIANIQSKYPEAVIVTEVFSGTTLDRPVWNKLYKQLREGDTVVFDEVSRMSRNAEEGFKLYKELYNRNVALVFLKESTLNTENFRQTAQIALTGNDIADIYIQATNRALMLLAEKQIQAAFQTAEHEVDFCHRRTSEGVRRAMAEGKQVGRATGSKVETKKAKEMKALILKKSKDFNGTMIDADLIKVLNITRNTFYKYKRELKAES